MNSSSAEEHLEEQTPTHAWKAEAGVLGQRSMQAARDPPGQPGVGPGGVGPGGVGDGLAGASQVAGATFGQVSPLASQHGGDLTSSSGHEESSS